MDPQEAADHPDRGRAFYQGVLASGDEDEVAEATFLMAALERNVGRTGEARAWFERAIATGHPDVTPKSWVNLAVLEAVAGRVQQARAAFREAAGSGHPRHSFQAMFNWALLERRQGDVDEARRLYQAAIDGDDPEHSRKAMINLAGLESEFRNPTAARELYERAIATGHEETAERARSGLRKLTEPPSYHQSTQYGGPDPELLRSMLGVDLDDIVSAGWANGRPGYGSGHLEYTTRDGEDHFLFVDIRTPSDFHVYMYFKDRFGMR